ncbi:uncharacterized protein LOC116290444 isoform X2 [Actinia tenebrosa]|uniref:Uncharacterized protein LOC116290444 isoform X2 n=1 Tax=Actinia tenebrosa TaxID=6105 RepID=A0A6P8HA59_ACTTE|nr:uncharacterized protein LOC116290444 isoform X2 [Actinia tenebrosa]
MFDLKYCGCGQSPTPDGTEGTVTVGWFQGENKVVHGCIVKNDEKFRELVNFEEEKPKYFAYIPRVEMNSNETFEISVHRFTHTKSPKKCKVRNLQNVKKLDVHDDHGYIFVPCEDESEKKTKKFNKSRFLKKHSKSIIEIPPDDVCKSGNVMGLRQIENSDRVRINKFFSFEIKASSPNGSRHYIKDNDFDKLEDTGPLLTKNNLVGYYEVKSRNEIKIYTFSSDHKEPRIVLAERALSTEMSDSTDVGIQETNDETTDNQETNLQPSTDANVQGSQTDRPNISSSRDPIQYNEALSENDERQNQTSGSSGNNDQPQLPDGHNVYQEVIAKFGGQDVIETVDRKSFAEEAAKYLQPESTSVETPAPTEIMKKQCRKLCLTLKQKGRSDIVEELRKILRTSGMTGPLQHDEKMVFRELPIKAQQDLFQAINDDTLLQRLVTELLGKSSTQTHHYTKKGNAAETILHEFCQKRRLLVGELYDILVKRDAAALADEYL